MQVFRSFEQNGVAMVGRAVRVLLVSSEGETGVMARRLAAMGAKVDVIDEIYEAVSDVMDDPAGYGLLVVDCDSANVGGLEVAQRAVTLLGAAIQRVPSVLISRDCVTQRFPQDRAAPVVLRAPLSAVSLKVGYEHALRERFMYEAA